MGRKKKEQKKEDDTIKKDSIEDEEKRKAIREIRNRNIVIRLRYCFIVYCIFVLLVILCL